MNAKTCGLQLLVKKHIIAGNIWHFLWFLASKLKNQKAFLLSKYFKCAAQLECRLSTSLILSYGNV